MSPFFFFFFFAWTAETCSTVKVLFSLYFVSDTESESIRSPESELESESEQRHHDSAPLLLCICQRILFWLHNLHVFSLSFVFFFIWETCGMKDGLKEIVSSTSCSCSCWSFIDTIQHSKAKIHLAHNQLQK